MHRPPHDPRIRRGFTLIELLVAIAIIGILAGLILAAVQGARRAAYTAAVVSEIGNLDKAMVDFKLKYGVDVPSSFVLHEDFSDYKVMMPSPETKRSLAIITSIWPSFDFTGGSDVNGNGTPDETINLNGIECLVFFLGGVCATKDVSDNYILTSDGTAGSGSAPIASWTPLGFSPNPQTPFSRAGTSRVGPFFTFDIPRLVPEPDGRSVPSYVDTIPGQQTPYAYASSSRGAFAPTAGSEPFCVNDLHPQRSTTGVFSVSVYLRPPGSTNTMVSMWGEPLNAKSFLLISPGFDNTFGAPPATGWEEGALITDVNGRDDIANFAGGTLE